MLFTGVLLAWRILLSMNTITESPAKTSVSKRNVSIRLRLNFHTSGVNVLIRQPIDSWYKLRGKLAEFLENLMLTAPPTPMLS